MDSRFFAIFAAAAVAALAIIGMLLSAGAAFAQIIGPNNSPFIPDTNNTISVAGTATTKVEPDRVMITFAVETVDQTAGDALRANSERMTAALQALQAAGVEENETSTSSFSIYPNYNFTEFGNARQLTGYTVTNSILVESSNLQNISDWVDAAVGAGANRIDSIAFTISEERMDVVRANLTDQAVDNARGKADALASALGMEITGVKAAGLNDFGAPIIPLSVSREAAMADTEVPIVPGEQTVTTTVTVIYKIGK
jgi:uncharacterized protein